MTALKTSIQGKKIGFSPNLGVFPVDPRVTSLVAQAVNAFENQGAHVIDLEIALTYSHQELSDLWCQIMAGNFGAVLDLSKQHGIDLLRDHPKELPTLLLEWMNKAHKRTLAQKLYVQHIQEKVFTAFEEAFSEVDFIVSPTVACLPVLNGEGGDTLGPSKLNGETINPLIGWCLTYFTNFTGHPSASVPAGLIDGLPVGLQVIGRRQADFDLLAACARFEEARPWKQIYKDIRKRALKANCQYSPGTLGTPNKVTLGQ
jgi:amidase/aspartyl-tRNA(Asn)/glutamyl-tRNA(Gln) amidotransferase subunit A